MRTLLLGALILVSAALTDAQTRVIRVTLTNDAPCAYVTRVILSDIGADGSVDVIQYFVEPQAGAIYFYRGSALWKVWKDDPDNQLPARTAMEGVSAPPDDEVGLVKTDGPTIRFMPLASARMRMLFTGASRVLGEAGTDGVLSKEALADHKAWIADRFVKDVQPETKPACATATTR